MLSSGHLTRRGEFHSSFSRIPTNMNSRSLASRLAATQLAARTTEAYLRYLGSSEIPLDPCSLRGSVPLVIPSRYEKFAMSATIKRRTNREERC
jgi:hypothetical protein